IAPINEQAEGEADPQEFTAQPSLQIPLALRYPQPPGRSIRRLRGSLPVTVAARKPDPLVIPLADATGKSFLGEDVALTVHSVKAAPNEPQVVAELTLRPRSTGRQGPSTVARSTGPLRLDFLDHQLEVVDTRGRAFVLFVQDSQPQADGVRISLLLAPGDG